MGLLGCVLVALRAVVQREEHVDIFLAVAFLSFTLLLKDANDFAESLYGCPFALQVLQRVERGPLPRPLLRSPRERRMCEGEKPNL